MRVRAVIYYDLAADGRAEDGGGAYGCFRAQAQPNGTHGPQKGYLGISPTAIYTDSFYLVSPNCSAWTYKAVYCSDFSGAWSYLVRCAHVAIRRKASANVTGPVGIFCSS